MPNKVERKKYIDVPALVKKNQDAIALAVAEAGNARAVGLAPRDTGNLVDSLEAKKLGGGRAQYGTNVIYGLYQEFGTRFMKAQPYLRPSADWLRKNGSKIAAKILKGALRRG